MRLRDRLRLLELKAVETSPEMQTWTATEQRNGVFFLVGLAALGWLLIILSVANMSSPLIAMTMPMDATWALSEIIAVWLMWAVMMGAMMMPSAIPMLIVHRRVAAKKDPSTTNFNRWFLSGYLVGWALFSAVATYLQWGFQNADVLYIC